LNGDDPESYIDYIYKDEIIVYNISSDYFYRRDKEDIFQTLSFDVQKKEFYPAYYQLLLERGTNSIHKISGEVFTQRLPTAACRREI
jgi:hypothetical protein